MGCTPCWLHTSSLMRSRSISLKYAADNYAAGCETQISQKSHQGWKEVLITSSSDPAAKTILRHSDDGTTSQFSRSPSATTPSHDRSSSTSQSRFRPVLAKEPSPVSTLLGASSPRFSSLPIGARVEVSAASFRIARKLGTLLPQGEGAAR